MKTQNLCTYVPIPTVITPPLHGVQVGRPYRSRSSLAAPAVEPSLRLNNRIMVFVPQFQNLTIIYVNPMAYATMARYVRACLAAALLGLLGWWSLNISAENGVDALLYHRMASAITAQGFAPWIVNPLSYIGLYPGSDSSGVPFLIAQLAETAGLQVGASVLLYDAALFIVFGLGLFLLIRHTTHRDDLALVSVILGCLSYGLFTSILWSADERSFNVALTPIFLMLLIPGRDAAADKIRANRMITLALVSATMLVSHLDFVLLIPYLVLVPLLHAVVHGQHWFRHRRWSSPVYFAAVSATPVILLAGMYQVGILADLGLDYYLSNSAVLSGSNPLVFAVNALIFTATRTGPCIAVLAAISILFYGSRSRLTCNSVTIGALLLTAFLGLPIVLYSKDLAVPVLTLAGVLGIGAITLRFRRRRVLAALSIVFLVVVSSVAFDAINFNRTTARSAVAFWSTPVVTQEDQMAGAWLSMSGGTQHCTYGNNPVVLQQVATDTGLLLCGTSAVDFLINAGARGAPNSSLLKVYFAGLGSANPSDWFQSPVLNQYSLDLSRVLGLDYDSGRALLSRYDVKFIVVALEKPTEVPLYNFQGSRTSTFFSQLWQRGYSVYRSGDIAVFKL